MFEQSVCISLYKGLLAFNQLHADSMNSGLTASQI